MTARYYHPELSADGGLVDLSAEEAHHATAVMRVQPNQPVTLFDGRGYEATGTVISASKRRVQCQVDRPLFLPRENQRSISIGLSLPKGDRARDLVQRLTELGVNRLVPLHCQRSPWKQSDNAIEKLRRGVIEACKQCHRNRLMEIAPPQPYVDFIAQPLVVGQIGLLAHPGCAEQLAATATGASDYRIAIGPEGGFSDQEVAAALAAGWTTVGLGERILRIETAAISLAVLAQRGFS